MKKGLIISREYTPMSNGSVTCLENILNVIKNDYDLTVVSYNLEGKYPKKECKNRIEIQRIYSKCDKQVSLRENFLQKRVHSNINWDIITKPIYFPFYLAAKAYGLIHPSAWSKNSMRHIEKVLNLNKFDFILAMGAPFENLRVATKVAQKYKMPLYIIEFDLFAYNPTHDLSNEKVVSKNLDEELSWYEKAEHIFVTKEMENTVMNSMLSRYEAKITAINMPNFIPQENDFKNIDTDYIDILYAGMFYEDIRNPQRMMVVFSDLFKRNPKIRLHIMGVGCENIIFKYKKQWPHNIIIYGKQPKEKVIDMTKRVDFLLNLSNTTPTQAPSKIIEYVSTGKPLINFYSIDNDRCVEILTNYQSSISLDERKGTKQLLIEMESFIKNNQGLVVDSSELMESFSEYSPQYVADKIIGAIEG